MVSFRWHAEGTERIWIFHWEACMCERGRDGPYTGMCVRQNACKSLCGLRKRHSRQKWLPHRQSPSLWNDTLYLTRNWFFQACGGFFSRRSLIAGSKFTSHSQLVYGPCMSSLTAAVFISRSDWYIETGRCPGTASSSSPLWLSSHPYAVRLRTSPRLERFIALKALYFTVFIVCVLWFTVENTCSMCAQDSGMLQFI